MKFTTAAVAFAGVAAASPVPPPEQSPPFELVLSSADKSIDGQKVSACHSGAAIEAACIGTSGAEFYFNTTVGSQAPVDGYSVTGNLVYNLPISNGPPESLSLNLFGDLATNVEEAIFEPGNGPYTSAVVFNLQTGKVARTSNLDDSVTPPVGGQAKAYSNWFVCQTYYTGYNYQTLAWVPGNGSVKPQNPSCIKVDVTRVNK